MGCRKQGDTQGFDFVLHLLKAKTGRNKKSKPEKVDFHMIAAIVTVAAIFASDPISDLVF